MKLKKNCVEHAVVALFVIPAVAVSVTGCNTAGCTDNRIFVEVLQRPTVTLLAEIFAAREDNDIGISSADLAAKIPGSVFCPTLEDVTEKLKRLAQPGDLILTVGAGDIYLAGRSEEHTSELQSRI